MDVKIGDCVGTKIRDVAFGGDGVGRHEDLVVFVPFTVDGDEAEIEITEVRKRYARGRLVRIIVPSSHRVMPLCRYYTLCGGCRMQHIGYTHQLELKHRQVAETFRRIAKFPLPSVEPLIGSPLPYGYRGKAEFHLAAGPGRSCRTGLMAAASNDLVDVERCEIVDESINRKYRVFREDLLEGSLCPKKDRLILWSDEQGEQPTEVSIETRGALEITRRVGDTRMAVPYGGFFQANLSLVKKLVEQVVKMSGLSGGETMIDAYGGSGLFPLFLGERAGRIYGIEGDRDAARCATLNLRRAGFPHVEWFTGDVADVLVNEFASRGLKVDLVVLDPPRDGCGRGVIDALAAVRPERIVYVSCNPATQARDVRLFSDCGYTLDRLQPIDMFPQTGHIEVVAVMTRGNG